MKKIVKRVQHLSQKAAEIKEAMEKAPSKIGEIREAVAMTTGQLRQLRADVQSSVADLRADDEDRLIDVFEEINESRDVLRQAGFELAGVDMELSPNQRLIVHLNRVEEVSQARLRSLRAVKRDCKTAQALVSALIQAEEAAGKVDLPGLAYSELVVHIGPNPSVRICWRADVEVVEEESATTVSSASTSKPAFAQSSFFERRPIQPATVAAAVAAETTPVTPSETPVPAAAGPIASAPASTGHSATAWTSDALEKFKKMPNLSKYQR